MPFDPAELNRIAAALIGAGTDEAAVRTCVGRLYYAAHLTAREVLIKRGWTPSGTGKDHRGVIEELASRHLRKESDLLAYLKDLREHADYHLEATPSPLNQACSLCKRMRKAGLAANNVTLSHWQEASDTSTRLFPKLQRI